MSSNQPVEASITPVPYRDNEVGLFSDRDGDVLSVTPRNIIGNTVPDPIISVIHCKGTPKEHSQSVVFTEDEAVGIINNLVEALSLNSQQLTDIIGYLKNIRYNVVVREQRI